MNACHAGSGARANADANLRVGDDAAHVLESSLTGPTPTAVRLMLPRKDGPPQAKHSGHAVRHGLAAVLPAELRIPVSGRGERIWAEAIRVKILAGRARTNLQRESPVAGVTCRPDNEQPGGYAWWAIGGGPRLNVSSLPPVCGACIRQGTWSCDPTNTNAGRLGSSGTSAGRPSRR
jgi:hypothetical protein